MSKIDLLEERLKELEEQKKEIETKIMFALKYNGNWKKK